MFRMFAIGFAFTFIGATAPLHAQGVVSSGGCCCGGSVSYGVQGQSPMMQPGMQGQLQASQTTQNYQRFSYQPAPAGAPTNLSGQQASAMNGATAPVQPQVPIQQSPMAPNSQGYRSYSYQPYSSYPSYNYGSNYSSSNNSGSRTPLWMYAKGDPRRYRP